MAQSPVIMAFRKRLKNAGYTEVSIVSLADETAKAAQRQYSVRAKEPLAGEIVRRQCTEIEMYHMFR